MNEDFFIGQDTETRRKQEIAATVKVVREIAVRLMDKEQLFGEREFLTEVLPAILVDQLDLLSDECECVNDLNRIGIATQNLLLPPGEVREALGDIEALGCRWEGL